MSEERKDRELPRFGAESESRGNLASRARNRTVLLTPDAVGQVRASMTGEAVQDPMNELLPPMSWEQPAAVPQSPPADEGYVGVGRAVDEIRAAQPERRSTGKFTSPVGPAAPKAQMAQTQVMPAPGGFGRPVEAPRPEPRPVAPQPAPVAARPKSKIVGFMVSFDEDSNGEIFEIRAGRWLVTSKPTDHGDFILINDESISPLHAIIRATAEGKVQVLDQLSEYGTGLFRAGTEEEEEIAGTMAAISHGDIVRFGKRHFTVCMVPGKD